ncbi:unnamed protein product [Oikopleura dioica]|uniref:protein xylosyltransferase n=2 Tax=Oikopleura dioica TaxID=34765 RepID=E4XE97_OIKDI|nr:unnamed protein product [Oikopleura dioica]
MRFRWRRLLLGLVLIFISLQLWALIQLDPNSLNENDRSKRANEPRSTQKPAQAQVPDRADVKAPENLFKVDENLCEVTHNDAKSAIQRASDECKPKIHKSYCDHKAGMLLPSRIERTCPHAKRFVAQAPAVTTKNPDAKIRICYFLIVHGRSLRQIKRLVKNIYHTDHVLYFHVDSRSHWLHSELKKLTLEYPNIFLADWRETPIWGGTSLLTTIFRGLTDMVEKQYKWDFFINLSFADFPVKSNDDLVQFLFKYRDKNFMKSHGREPEKFITKQGLDRVFFECDNHMYRISERKTPIGIEIDGGSDWIALNREFSEWLVFSKDENLEQLKIWFNFTLLPAESFFHTAVQNTHWCESFVDNNIRVTNWNRARGCKCQYKAIVDWCGCSPNDFMPKDLNRLKTSRPIFFARKFEEFVSQEAVHKVEADVYGEYSSGTPSLNSYWENIYNAEETERFSDPSKADITKDGQISIFNSWKRLAKLDGSAKLTDVHIYLERKRAEVGYVLEYKLENGDTRQIYVKKKDEPNNESDEIPISIQIGTKWDVKELVFRDPGGLISTQLPIHASLRFHNVHEKFHAIAVIQDPSGTPADQIEMDIPEDEEKRKRRAKTSTFHCEGELGGEVVAADKLALSLPLRPGVWTVSVYVRGTRSMKYIEDSKTHFTVSPLGLFAGKPIGSSDAARSNGGAKVLNNKKKDLKLWNRFIDDVPTADKSSHFALSLAKNSSFVSEQLNSWTDEILSQGWTIASTCTTNSLSPLPDCSKSYWSTFYPDPKSELGEVNSNGRLRN